MKIRTAFFALLAILCFGCQSNDDNWEKVKKFKPEDNYFSASLKTLHFMIETNKISTVDSVFSDFIDYYGIPITAEKCKDGIYTGESTEDAYDYKHVVSIEIKNEKIIAIDYDEVKIDGTAKESDSVYNKQMSVTGTSPAIAYPEYENNLLEKQNIMEVDAVSGATYSLYRFRYAIMLALMKARVDNEEVKKSSS